MEDTQIQKVSSYDKNFRRSKIKLKRVLLVINSVRTYHYIVYVS